MVKFIQWRMDGWYNDDILVLYIQICRSVMGFETDALHYVPTGSFISTNYYSVRWMAFNSI